MSTDRVGPFEVVREVTRAPGLTLVEARDPDGQRRLLQLARFRAPLDDEERGARQHHEKQIARQTMELMTASSDVVVHAHGGADATDGERFLFWALPWGESPLLVERAALGVDELIAIGIGLARRMARRHADGMVEPILTEHVLRMDEMGTIQVVAIPVSIDEEWRSAATPAMRFAPEETSPEGVVPSGDIWRLGRLLLALGDKTTLPKRVREGIERLAAANPDDRPKNAHEARLLLERVGAPVHTSESVPVDTGETAMTAPSPLDPLAVTSWTTPADRQWTEPGEEASRPIPAPNFERSTDRLLARVTPPVPASEMVTSQASPLEVRVGLPTVQDARIPTTDPASMHTDPEGEPASDELMDLSDDVVLVAEGAPDFSSSTTLRDQPAHDSADTAPTNGAPAALLAEVSETTVRLDVTASNESAEATLAAQSAKDAIPQGAESVTSADVATDAVGELASSTGADALGAGEIDTQVRSSSKSVAAADGDAESVEPADGGVSLAASDGRDSESAAPAGAEPESVAAADPASQSVAAADADSEFVAATAVDSKSAAATVVDSEFVAAAAADSKSVGAAAADSKSVGAAAADSKSVGAAAADSKSVAATAADSKSVAATAADSKSVAATAADSESVAAAAADSESVAAAAADSESVAAAAADSESVAAAAADSESVAAAAADSEFVAAAAADSESVAATDADSESVAATAADSESVAAAAADSESVAATDADSESVAATAADSESVAATDADSESVAATDADSESMATAGDQETGPSQPPRDVAATVEVPEASTSIETAAEVTSDPPSDPASDRDPLAAAWEQPVLPPGESPWSEVVSTRGAHHRAHEEFPGLRGEVPVGPIGGPSPKPAAEVSTPTPLPYVAPGGDDVDMELIDAISGFDWRKLAAGAVVVLVIFGLFALIARSGGEADNTDVVVAPSTNEFKLQSKPSGATVVAVRDGHVLGKTPLEFLVPNRSRVQVILVAGGYEPLRLDLPERGGLTVELSKRSAKPCEVTITGVDNARLEGIGFEAGEGHRLQIPGAGVVRVADGQRVVGASIVYCPALGGNATEALAVRPRSNPAAVRLTEPAGAAAYIDGEPIGRVPTVARVEAAFAHVRVDDASGMSEERWVPTGDNIEVRMPTPKPRKIPVLLVPDGLPKPAASAPRTEDDADDDDETSEATAVEPATVAEDAPRRRGPRLTRAQRRARARRYLDEGTRAMVSDRPKTARSKFRACIRMDPSNAECHRELGTVYRRLRRPQASRQYYLKYLELRPDARDAATIRRLLR